MPIQIPVVQTGFEASIEAAARKAGRNLKIDLGASSKSINALSQPLGRITGQADEFTKSMEAANARVLAFGASVGVLNSVMQAFKGIVTSTIEVQKSIMDINSILQKNSKDIAQFQKEIFNVARETGNSFKTVSEAALELSRQGLPANQVIGRLKDSMILARLSGLDAAQAVEGLTASINSFSKQGLTSSQVLNKISAAAAEFAVSERDLIEGFKRSASVAQQAGVSIDELGGIITAVQQKTARGGAVIGNSFKTIFTRIRRSESLDLLSDIGVKVYDLEGRLKPASKLIEDLASKISTLNDVDVANITEKIGGGFQIAPLLAALDDYSSKTSVARKATETFLNASDQAYQRNTALNQAMAAAINEASINLKEFAVTLGEIGITKNLTNILTFFNTFISDVKNLLQGDGLGSDFAKGVVKGIGGVLSGPGLAVFAGIILKLTTDLVKFGTTSLKTFFNVGTAAKEINALQSTIANTLLRNKDIQDQILKLEGNRVAQAKFFTTALNQQLTTMERMKTIAASIAPTVYQGTAPTRRGITKTGAGGYMPAVSQETRDISRGVGGARAGDKPVVMENFAFGGGKKGTMVAHTGEYVVPNFAGGGSAIFNRKMIASMGLPAGAKKIGAAGGFIPNFAQLKELPQQGYRDFNWSSFEEASKTAKDGSVTYNNSQYKISKSQFDRALAVTKNKQKKAPLDQLIPINQDGREFGMIVGERGVSSPQTRFADNTGKTPTPNQTESSKYRIEVPVYRIQDEKLKFTEVPKLTEDISKLAATAALRLAKGLSGNKMPKPENKAYIEKTLNPGTLGGTAGTIFEAGIAGILNSNDFKDYEKIPRNSLIDFRGNFSDIRKLYNIPNGRAEIGVEAKGSSGADLVSSAAEKFLKVTMGEDPFSGQKRKKAANGYIPNFAYKPFLTSDSPSQEFKRWTLSEEKGAKFDKVNSYYNEVLKENFNTQQKQTKKDFKASADFQGLYKPRAGDLFYHGSTYDFDGKLKGNSLGGLAYVTRDIQQALKYAKSTNSKKGKNGYVYAYTVDPKALILDSTKSENFSKMGYDYADHWGSMTQKLPRLKSFENDFGNTSAIQQRGVADSLIKKKFHGILQKQGENPGRGQFIPKFAGTNPLKFGFKGAQVLGIAPNKLKNIWKKKYEEIAGQGLNEFYKNKYQAASGFLPNFADPLKEAIGREMSAGVPASQIYVDQNSSLKNPMNPMGLMVANRRDEPAGGMQGINRARKEGANPMLYGAAGGFVPNYAPIPAMPTMGSAGNSSVANKFNAALNKATLELQNGSTTINQVIAELGKIRPTATRLTANAQALAQKYSEELLQRQQAVATRILESNAGRKLAAQLDKVYIEYNKSQKSAADLDAAQKKAAAILQKTSLSQSSQRAVVSSTAGLAGSRSSASPESRGSRDLLGTVFAVQTGLSFLSSSTEGASSGLGKFTNILANSLSTFTTTTLAIQALGGIGGKLGSVFSKLGPWGMAAGAGLAAWQGAKGLYHEFSGANKLAAENTALLAQAANKAAVRLEELSAGTKFKVEQKTKDVIYNLFEGQAYTKEGKYVKPGDRYTQASATSTGYVPSQSRGDLVDIDYGQDVTSESQKAFQEAFKMAMGAGISEKLLVGKVINESGENNGTLHNANINHLIKQFIKLSENPQLRKVKENLQDIFEFEDSNINDLLPPLQKVANLIKEGKITEEQKKQVVQELVNDGYGSENILLDQINQASEKGIELTKQKAKEGDKAAKAVSKELTETLKLLRIQQSIDKRKLGEEGLSKSAELAKQMATSSIQNNLGLSETQKARGVAFVEKEYSKLNETLKTAAANQAELDKLIEKSSGTASRFATSLGFDKKGEIDAMEASRKVIQNFVSNKDNASLIQKGIDTQDSGVFTEELKQAMSKEGALLKGLTGQKEFIEANAIAALEYANAIDKNKKLSELVTFELEKQYLINDKNKRIEEAKANIIRKTNYDLESRASALSARAGDISNKQSLLQAEKELEIVKYQKTSTATTVQEQAAELERINQKYFDLEMANEREKAILEARAELTRNLKVDDNTLKIGDNTTATLSLTDLLQNQMLEVLSAMPKNIRDAIIEARNALPDGTAGGDTQSGNNQTLNLGTDYGSNGTVVGNQKLEEIRNSISKIQNTSRGTEIKPEQMQKLAINARRFLGFDKTDIGTHEGYNTLFVNGKAAPAGMRNNNPGNLIWSREDLSKEYGSIATSINRDNKGKDPQLVFNDPLTGMTAAAQLALKKYNSQTSNFKTVMKIISDQNGWTQGNTEAARNVALNMGISPDEDIQLNDPEKLKKFLKGLVKQEQGEASSVYTDELYEAAIANAINIRSSGSKNQTPAPPMQSGANDKQMGSGIQANVNSKYGARNPDAVGGTRNIPLSATEQGRKLFNVLQEVSKKMELQYDITSALQEPKGTRKAGRVGGTRHDKNVGSADIKLMKDGNLIDFTTPEGEKIAEKFVAELFSRGITGVGAGATPKNYMGPNTMHVGYGSPAVWGGTPDRPGPVPDWLKKVFNQSGYLSVNQTSKELTAKQFGLTDAAIPEAQKIAQMEYEDMGKAAKEAAKKILGAGESTEKIDKYAESLQQYATALRKNANTEATQRGIRKINTEKDREAAEPGTFGAGFGDGMKSINSEIDGFAYKLGESIPNSFADNMASAMEKIIMDGEDFGSSLRSAATSFLSEINKANIKNLANLFASGAQQVGSSIFNSFASGGPITGGSGKKDDVPALLMGGEFVMNKKAVSKYGMNLMNQLNNGNLPKFAKGGSVEETSDISELGKNTIFSGKVGSEILGQYNKNKIPTQSATQGSFYSPGMYGSGAIKGKENLLSFATQTQTSGAKDVIVNESGFSYVSLEPESARLTTRGRMQSPEFQAVQRDKEEAFNLYLQQYGQEKQAEEDYKAQKKAFKKQLVTALISTVANAGIKAIAQPALAGFQAGMNEAATKGMTGFNALGSGFKGVVYGGNIEGTQIGGLSNLFSGNSELANIGNVKQLNTLYRNDPNSPTGQLIASNFNNYTNSGLVPMGKTVNRATGGLIPNTSGTDTVPAMLSGGEFVMNRAATQNIGTGTLQSLNTGAGSNSLGKDSSEGTEKIISKLDELIRSIKENMSGNVSVNVSSDGSSKKEGESTSGGDSGDSQSNAAFAKRIKEAVIQVIQQEKRLGGTLRST
jgi:TP901 family phage tail tape measure protein